MPETENAKEYPAVNARVIVFRFGWGTGKETSVHIGLTKSEVATILSMVGPREQLPDLTVFRTLSAMRAEAELFAAVRRCKFWVEQTVARP